MMADVALVLAQCDKALATITQREAIEVVTGEADDVADVQALECATSLLESALGIVARLSFGELAESMLKSETDLAGTPVEKIRMVKEQLQQLLDASGTNKKGDVVGVAGPTESEVISMEMTKEELVGTVASTVDQILGKRDQMRKAEKAAKKAKAEKAAADEQAEQDRIRKAAEDMLKELTPAAPEGGEGEIQKGAGEGEPTVADLLKRLEEQDRIIKGIADQPAGGGPFVGAAGGSGGAGIPNGGVGHPRGLTPDAFAAQRAEIQKGEQEGKDMTSARQELGRAILAGVYEARGYSTSPVQAGRHA
jgi:hypothetical protein